MDRQMLSELAYSVGLTRGNIRCILDDRKFIDYFEDRGITEMDLKIFDEFCERVSRAFYSEKKVKSDS